MYVDASQLLADGTPAIPPLPPVEMSWLLRMDEGAPLDVTLVKSATHAGTHVDAPSHAIPGGATIDQIPLDRFDRRCHVVSVDVPADGTVSVDDIAVPTAGMLEPGDALMVCTGWGQLFGTDAYREHPALSVKAAKWIVEQGISIVAVDLLTVDLRVAMRPPDFDFPVHRTLLGNDVLIIENVRDMSAHAGLARLLAFPLPYAGRDAAQARVILEV